MSIRRRLLYLVLAVWLPAVLGFALLASLTYQRETASARDQVEQMARGLNFVIERELDGRVVMAKTLASSIAVRDKDFGRFHEEASKAVAGTSNWAFVMTPDQLLVTTLISFDAMHPILRPKDAEFTTGMPSVRFRPRGLQSRGAVLGVFAPEAHVTPPRFNVGIAFEAAVIQEAVDRLQLPSGSVASVIDSKQLLIARSRNPQEWVGKPATGGIIQRIQAGQTGFARSVTLDGVPSWAYLTPTNRYGWVAVIATPVSAVAATANRLSLQTVGAAALLLAVGLALARYASSRISDPMTQLRDAAKELADEKVPLRLSTGVLEADEVSEALHEAGLRATRATATLEEKVRIAVDDARQAQASLLDARKHEAIGRLTGGIAHDFNNLLQTMSTGHQILDRTLADGAQRRVLQSAQRATAKAAELVKRMLTFGRAQGMAPGPVNVVDLLLKSQDLTRKGLGERIALREEVAGDLPLVFVDATQLELALLNLVFNARDAMPHGGTVTVVARLARPQETAGLGPGPFVCIDVTDDGEGMDDETRSKAFDPYFTTKPVGAGSGLGLAQVLALARQSGGDVRLDSEIGRGTSVRLYLPVHASGPVESIERKEQADVPEGRKLRILMVEDDVLVASVVVSALEIEGHDVTLCSTADGAIPLLQQEHRFDVLFTDVVMPGAMTGLDLVAWCRENQPRLPAVVATGYTSQQGTHGARLLSKPYTVENLLASLYQATANPPSVS